MAMIAELEYLSLIDDIHAAALEPAGWNRVLRRLAAATGCIAGGLTIEDPTTRQGRPITYFGFDPGHVERTFDHFLPLNPLFAIAPSLQPGAVVTNGDVIPTEAFRRTEFYDGWARPQELCSPISLILHRDAQAYVPITLVRADKAGEASDTDRALLHRLYPHLSHAWRTNLRLDLLQTERQLIEEVAARLATAMVVVDAKLSVIYLNPAGEDAFATGLLTLRDGRLGARDAASNRQLQTAMAAGLRPSCPLASELLLHRAETAPLHVVLTPIPSGSAVGGLTRRQPCCLIAFNDTGASTASAAATAGRHYRLTTAERRILEALLRGQTLAEGAAHLRIARSTAQTQLHSMFAKTGTRRQADLLQRVATMTPTLRLPEAP